MVMEQRRKWWAGMMQLYGKQEEASAQKSERLEGEEKKSA